MPPSRRGPDRGESEGPVDLWLRRLAQRLGLPPEECERRRAILLSFCAERGMGPSDLLDRWLADPDLARRRTKPGLTRADARLLVVESFLIHNGINIFGDLVCVPVSQKDLADQGPWFTGRS